MGETVRPRCDAAPPVNGTARRTTGRAVLRHSSRTSASGPASCKHLSIGPFPAVARQAEHRLTGGIQGADDAVAVDDEEPGCQAGDDFAAQTLRGFGARLHRALAVAELAHGLFHGSRHEGGLAPGFPLVLGGGAGRGEDAEDGVREDGRQRRDDRGQPEEEVAALGHGGSGS